MNQLNIHSIFSTPIYKTSIERKFTKKELQFVKNQKNYCYKNAGNIRTIETYILNKPELSNIKKFLEKELHNYLREVICPKGNVELYITQSWLNYTETNQYHHKHEHPNSIVSGVLYFDSHMNNDKIVFSHPIVYQQMRPEVNKYNVWNSGTWFFPVQTRDLFMFPSSTTHQVDTKKGNNTRISLAFNTFYRGTLGSKDQLQELVIHDGR